MSNAPLINPEWLVGIRMTFDQKSKWIEALRSGEYKQRSGYLYQDGGYCCLGVLCASVFGMAKPNGYYIRIAESPLGDKGDIQDLLANLNDSGVWSFEKIADFIEANIPACDEAR